MSDDRHHYEIKNELSSMNSKLGAVDKEVYDVKRDVDIILEWACVIGVAVCIIAFVAVIGMIALIAMATRG